MQNVKANLYAQVFSDANAYEQVFPNDTSMHRDFWWECMQTSVFWHKGVCTNIFEYACITHVFNAGAYVQECLSKCVHTSHLWFIGMLIYNAFRFACLSTCFLCAQVLMIRNKFSYKQVF